MKTAELPIQTRACALAPQSIIQQARRLVMSLAILAVVPVALAATDTWTGLSTTTANWSDPANWLATTTPATNDSLIFSGATQLNNTNDLPANAPLGGLTFAAGAGAFVLNGNAIAPSNSPSVIVSNAVAGPEVINLNIAPASAVVFGVAAGGSLTNNGVISGTANLSQTGLGSVTFTATNTFTGPIGGIAGTLAIGGAGKLNNGLYAGIITNNGTFAYNSSSSQTNTGVAYGTGKLVVNGPGTLTLGATNNFSGGTTVNGGTLQLNIGGSAGSLVGMLNINPGATVISLVTDGLGYGVGTCVTNVNIAGGTFIDGAPAAGNVSYLATYNLTGATISSTAGGAINMNTNAGFNTFATNITTTISSPVSIRGGNLVYTVATGTTANGIDLLVSGTNSVNGGSGVLVKAGAGTMAMTSANTFNAGLIISNGTFALNGSGSLNSGNFGGYITNFGTFNFNSSASQTLSGGVYGSGAINFNTNELIVVTGGSGSGTVTVAAGATNGVQLAAAGGQWTVGNLNYSSGATYADFNFGNNSLSTTAAPLNVTTNLAIGGTLNIIVRSTAGIASGDYPLIKYAGTLTGTPPTAPLVVPAGVTATIFNNTANKSIDLNVTVGNQVNWAVGSGIWDINTSANWNNSSTYQDGDNVIFNDTASGASPIQVALNTTVNPASVTVNNSAKNYVIGGSGSIAGPASLTKLGVGSLTLTNNNSYTNATTLDAGTTVLDFTSGAANNIIPTTSPVVFASGTLNMIGNANLSSSQTFANTTFNNGSSVISVTNGTLALGAMTEALGGTVMFNGPATDIGVTGNSIPVAASGTITTTTAGAGYTANLISGASTTSGYATVGLYDWAATSGNTIVGGSQVSGFYSVGTANAAVNNDITASLTGPSSTASGQSMRFNTPATITLTTRSVIDGAGILVTPNVGANNIIFATSGSTHQWSANRNGANRAPVTWMNNTLGLLLFGMAIADTGTAPDQYVQTGPGTVVYTADGTYTGQTYLNGGVAVITDSSIFGAASGNQTINLSGGTVVATNTFSMDNGGSPKRPFNLGFGGGGLAAVNGKAITVDGIITGAANSGSLWIGIPATSANGNVLGLVPGTGAGTANTTPVMANGTVNLTGANTYPGGTILYSGVLNFIPGALGSGGITFAGGTLQWPSGNTTDVSSNGVSILSAGGTLDVNGNNITLANSIGNNGGGGFTLVSSAANGVLNLNGANTYTGSTIVSGGTTLKVNNSSGSATGTGNVNLQIGALLSGGGTIAGSLTTTNGTTISPGSGVGTLTVGGTLTINSGSLFNYEFNSNPTNDMIVAGGLAINDASHNSAFNLYQAGTTLPATVSGKYNLIKYSGSDPVLDSSWTTVSGFNPHIANPQVGSAYSFAASGGYLTVTVTVDTTVTLGLWNVDANGNWSDNTKWSSNPKVPGSPGPGDSATFGVGTAFRIVTNDAVETVGGLRFTNNNSFLIAPGAGIITMNNKGGLAPIYVTGGTSNTIQTAIALTNTAVLNVVSGASLAISGTVSNLSVAAPATLTINGAGAVVLSGNNTYGPAANSFGTTLASGTLLLGNNNALGAGDVAVTGSSTIAPVAPISVPNNLDVSVGNAVTVTNSTANTLTLGGVISDSGALVKSGSGIVTLGSANTYSGGTTVNGGSLGISADTSLGAVTPLILNNGGLLANATVSLNSSRNINVGPATGSTGGTALLDAAGGRILTVSGNISVAGNVGANNLIVNSLPGSTGTVLLSNGNGFNGTTLTAGGTLQLANSLALQNSTLNYSNGSVVFDPSIAAATLGGLTGTNNLNLTNLSATVVALTIGNNGSSTIYNGSLNDYGAGATLTKIGSGTFALAGTNNNLTGLITGNAGTLAITNGGVLNAGQIAGQGFLVNGGTLTIPAGVVNNLNQVGNAFNESAGTVTVDTIRFANNDAGFIGISGGSFSANLLTMQRNNNNAAPTATAPVAAPTTVGLYVNGTNATVNLGSLVIGATGANSSAASRLDAGIVTVTNQLMIGDWGNSGRWNILQVNGGVLNSLDPALDPLQGIVVAAGNSQSELYLSGGTTLAQSLAFGSASDSGGGSGFLIVTNASLYIGANGIFQAAPTFTTTISLINGTIGSITNWSSTNNMQLNGSSFTFQAAYTNGLGSSLSNNITLNGVLSGSGSLIKTGGGTLTLTGANTLTNTVIVRAGTLALGNNALAGVPLIYVTNNAVLDVSAAPFTLLGAQTLQSGGTNNGSFTAASGSKIYPGTDLTYGTNTFNNSLTLGNGATVNFDVGTVHNGSNDLINVGGNLALQVNSLHLKAPGTAATLDTNGDYVLFNVAGTISGSFSTVPVWDVAPANSNNFTVVTDPNLKQVRLHVYGAGVVPPSAVGSASPSIVYALQSSLVTVTVTPGSSAVSSVVLDTSPYGGTSPVNLVLSGTPNVYTNTITFSASPTIGAFALSATVTDSDGGTAVASIALTVQPGLFWNGGAADNNWGSGGNWVGGAAPATSGSILTFAGSIRTTPNMETAYGVNGLTFDPSAAAFTLNSAGNNTLALNGAVTNNSPNVQTFNMPLAITGTNNVNTLSGNVVINGNISDGGLPGAINKVGTNTLTLTNNNSFSGGIDLEGGTGALALMSDYSGGGGSGLISVASGSTVLLASANAMGNNTFRMRGGSTLKLRSDTSTSFATADNNITAPSASLSLTFDVSNLTAGVKNNTLTLPENLNFTSSADQTINITGNSTYTLSLGNITQTTTSHAPYFNLFVNTIVGGPNVTINSITTGNYGNDVEMNGGGTVTVTGNLGNTSNGSLNLYVNNGTTVTLQGQSVKTGTANTDAYKYDVVNGTLVLDNGGALINNTSSAGLAQSVFVLGAATNIFSGSGYTHTNAIATNNNFNAAVYLGDTNNLAGGLSVPANITNNVSDGDIGFTNNGTFIIGGQNTSGANYYYNPIILGWTANRGKSVTLVAATGGEVDFDGGIFKNGTDTTAGVTVGNGPGFAGLVSFQAANTYAGPTTISNGTLGLTGSGSISNSTPISVLAGATFDVTGVGGYTLASSRTLKGNGTVNGSLTTLAGSTLAPGNPVGTLTVNGSVTLAGTTAMNLNRTNTPVNSSQLIATGTVTGGGTLTVTNIGPALQTGDTFHLFSSGVSGFTVNIATNDANKVVYTWENDVASLGSVKVLSVTQLVNTNPATANFSATTVGNTLQFNWSPDHLGWQLYTNAVGLTATTSWFPVAGSAAVTNETISINPAIPNVFFQLRYP